MEDQIRSIGVFSHILEEISDFRIVGYITRIRGYVRAECSSQLFDVFLQPFTLVVEDQLCAGLGPGLCDRPGDTAFIGNTKNDTDLTIKSIRTHASYVMERGLFLNPGSLSKTTPGTAGNPGGEQVGTGRARTAFRAGAPAELLPTPPTHQPA